MLSALVVSDDDDDDEEKIRNVNQIQNCLGRK